MNPRIEYRKDELNPMLDFANSELGTPYSVLPTVTGKTLNTSNVLNMLVVSWRHTSLLVS